ncbi:FAD-dependent oxidoreductase [Aspergillus undulatus]|uniref:FAD-dependent oxidoreductase n=1 Tax=Aspergillus undulatus TaxID=1810928 RepID=UPI003CCE014E
MALKAPLQPCKVIIVGGGVTGFALAVWVPDAWVQRSSLLEVMYDCISDKSKLLTGKRVETIRHLNDAAEVITGDGSIYRGDLVIGADGTHSRVRQEMARHAKELGVEGFDDGDRVTTTYACSFVVSTSIPGIPRGLTGFGAHKHFSYCALRFVALQSPGLMTMIRVVKEHWNDQVAPKLKFSDLYEVEQRVGFSPLGDASHKMTVVLGQGGAQGLETATALTNHLVRLLSISTLNRMPVDEIQSMFQQVQDVRGSQVAQMMKTPELEEMMLRHSRSIFPDMVLQQWDSMLPGAVFLNMLDNSARPRLVPFHDEVEGQAAKASKL